MSNKEVNAIKKTAEERALVPKRRFPEFLDAGEWHTYLIEELENFGWITLGRGNVISNQDIKATPGEYPIYSSSVKNNGHMGSYGRFMFDEELISWSVDGGGDFFYRPPHKFSVTNVSGYMRLDTNRLNYRFTASQLQSLHASLTFDYQFKAHPSVIRKLYRLAIPSTAEQHKIADCLASLDELISLEGLKLDMLRAHKKGLTQRIFPVKGETQPKQRFPEFRDGQQWVSAKLGDIANVQSGGTPSRANPDYWGGTIPWVTTSLIDSNIIFNSDEHITKLGLEESAAKIFPKGTILMAMYGQGKTRGKVAMLGIDAATNQACAALLLKNTIETRFVFQNLASRYDEIRKISNPGGQENLSAGLIEGISFSYPENQREQQRIADLLTSFNELTDTQTKKLAALKNHKKGLMQQLFPVRNEVSA